MKMGEKAEAEKYENRIGGGAKSKAAQVTIHSHVVIDGRLGLFFAVEPPGKTGDA